MIDPEEVDIEVHPEEVEIEVQEVQEVRDQELINICYVASENSIKVVTYCQWFFGLLIFQVVLLVVVVFSIFFSKFDL